VVGVEVLLNQARSHLQRRALGRVLQRLQIQVFDILAFQKILEFPVKLSLELAAECGFF